MRALARAVGLLGTWFALSTLAGCVADDPIDLQAVVLRVSLDSCRPSVENRATAVSIGDGLALTVAHSFDEARAVRVVGIGGVEVGAEVVMLDRDRDIAVLAFDRDAFGPMAAQGLEMRSDADDPLDEARVVIHRLDATFVEPVTILRRASVTLDGEGRREGIEIDAEIERGDSGAPIVDDEGRIIAMVFATSRTGQTAWTIAASELLDAVDEIGEPIDLTCQ